MKHSDYENFKSALLRANAVSANPKPFNDGDISYFFDVLCNYSIEQVLRALITNSRQNKFSPTAPDIITIIDSVDQRISADEAWAMMPKSEAETVVWTHEMAEAYSIAYDLIMEGDKIGGRMAFKGAYDRLCAEAMANRVKVKWKAALGYDKTLVAPVLEKAVALGRIHQNYANKLIPAPMEGGIIAGLLTGKITELPDNAKHLKERWGQLKNSLEAGQKQLADKKAQEIEDRNNRRLAFEAHRQEMIDRALIVQQGELH